MKKPSFLELFQPGTLSPKEVGAMPDEPPGLPHIYWSSRHCLHNKQDGPADHWTETLSTRL